MSNIMQESEESTKLVRLMSCEGKEFQVLERIASMSKMISYIMEENFDEIIPIPNVDGKSLALVIEFCDYHSHPESLAIKLKDFNKDFLNRFDGLPLMELTMAAHYLEVPQLLEILHKKHAENIKVMSVEDVREYFRIESDFTAEEEAKIREENSWAFCSRKSDIPTEEEAEICEENSWAFSLRKLFGDSNDDPCFEEDH